MQYTFGVNAWKQWVTTKNAELEKSSRRVKLFNTEILQLTSDELNYSLCLFVKEVRKPNGAEYAPDTIYYLCLGIQQYLFENGRIDNIFCDPYYEKFTDCLDEVAKKFSVLYNDSHYIVTRVEEEHLWESKQLGAHSPHVLLSTLMFFNTKHFNLTVRQFIDVPIFTTLIYAFQYLYLCSRVLMNICSYHSLILWNIGKGILTSQVLRSFQDLETFCYDSTLHRVQFVSIEIVYLCFWFILIQCWFSENNARKKKVYEQQENEENPLRCPVKLYEFYLSKW